MTWTACLVFVGVDIVLGLKRLTVGDIVKELATPFYEQYWFITTYILFILIEPFLRNTLANMDILLHKRIVMILTIVVGFSNFVWGHNLGYHLADFLYIYGSPPKPGGEMLEPKQPRAKLAFLN